MMENYDKIKLSNEFPFKKSNNIKQQFPLVTSPKLRSFFPYDSRQGGVGSGFLNPNSVTINEPVYVPPIPSFTINDVLVTTFTSPPGGKYTLYLENNSPTTVILKNTTDDTTYTKLSWSVNNQNSPNQTFTINTTGLYQLFNISLKAFLGNTQGERFIQLELIPPPNHWIGNVDNSINNNTWETTRDDIFTGIDSTLTFSGLNFVITIKDKTNEFDIVPGYNGSVITIIDPNIVNLVSSTHKCPSLSNGKPDLSNVTPVSPVYYQNPSNGKLYADATFTTIINIPITYTPVNLEPNWYSIYICKTKPTTALQIDYLFRLQSVGRWVQPERTSTASGNIKVVISAPPLVNQFQFLRNGIALGFSALGEFTNIPENRVTIDNYLPTDTITVKNITNTNNLLYGTNGTISFPGFRDVLLYNTNNFRLSSGYETLTSSVTTYNWKPAFGYSNILPPLTTIPYVVSQSLSLWGVENTPTCCIRLTFNRSPIVASFNNKTTNFTTTVNAIEGQGVPFSFENTSTGDFSIYSWTGTNIVLPGTGKIVTGNIIPTTNQPNVTVNLKVYIGPYPSTLTPTLIGNITQTIIFVVSPNPLVQITLTDAVSLLEITPQPQSNVSLYSGIHLTWVPTPSTSLGVEPTEFKVQTLNSPLQINFQHYQYTTSVFSLSLDLTKTSASTDVYTLNTQPRALADSMVWNTQYNQNGYNTANLTLGQPNNTTKFFDQCTMSAKKDTNKIFRSAYSCYFSNSFGLSESTIKSNINYFNSNTGQYIANQNNLASVTFQLPTGNRYQAVITGGVVCNNDTTPTYGHLNSQFQASLIPITQKVNSGKITFKKAGGAQGSVIGFFIINIIN